MEAGSFSVTAERDEATVTLRVAGELDLARTAELERCWRAEARAGDHVVVDLGGLRFIDSSGLKALLAIHDAAGREGFTYTLLEGPPEVHRTFVLTGLDRVLPFAA